VLTSSKIRANRDPPSFAVSYINTASHPFESQIPLSNKSENLSISLGYILMDSVLFYVPPVPASQPPRSSGGRAAFLPDVAPFPSFTITGNSARQTTAQRSNRNETRKDFDMVRCADVSDPALPGHLSKQRTCRDDLVQVQGTC
jgi:hypothetical protein